MGGGGETEDGTIYIYINYKDSQYGMDDHKPYTYTMFLTVAHIHVL